MKALIVGAGLSGLTAAVLLKRKGWDIRVLETRNHPGGNCWDYLYNGVHVHKYGPHIFHTNSEKVYRFFGEFTGLTGYVHRVMAQVPNGDRLLSVPYNKTTVDQLGREMTDDEIIEAFFRNYSEKMWGCKYNRIPKMITDRVNLRRLDYNDGYFLDKYQGMPSDGYAAMFTRMMDEIGRQNCYFAVTRNDWRGWSAWQDLIVFTGSLDEYFRHEYGCLPYRAMEFDFRHSQPKGMHAVINWCDARPAIRTTDYACFYTNPAALTVLGDEYPAQWEPGGNLVPSHPMRGFPEADELHAKYMGLPPKQNVVLCGRLGTYKYMNMDTAISDTIDRLEKKLGVTLYA